MKEDINIEVLIKYLSGKASETEAAMITAWRSASEKNAQQYQKFKAAWEQQTVDKISFSNSEIEAAWQEVRQATIAQSQPKQQQVTTPKWRKLIPAFQKIAAVVFLGLAVGYAINTYLATETEEDRFVQTLVDEQKEVLLADGTTVWLNRESALRYDENFNTQQREVYLKGEAYFEVAKNPEKPFIIHNEKMTVQVLGTAFNVDNRSTTGKQIVTVTSGKVAVYEDNNSKNRVELVKNEVAVFDKATQNITQLTNDNPNFLSWKTGQLIFEKSSLQTTLSTLENHYHIHFKINQDFTDDYRFNASFDNQPLEEVLLVMETSLGLKFENQEKYILVTVP